MGRNLLGVTVDHFVFFSRQSLLTVLLPVLLFSACGGQEGLFPGRDRVPAGGVVVTEIMAYPEGGGMEWVEAVNLLPFSLDGEQLVLVAGGEEISLSCSGKIGPGEYFVMARGSGKLNGAPATCTWTDLQLPEEPAQVDDPVPANLGLSLRDRGDGHLVDQVGYLVEGIGFPQVEAGRSLELCREMLTAAGNDQGEYWIPARAYAAIQEGGFGTPGTAGISCGLYSGQDSVEPGEDVLGDDAAYPEDAQEQPEDTGGGADWGESPAPPSAGTIYFTELMPDPLVVSDSEGEWFEVYYCGSAAADFRDLELQIDGKTPSELAGPARVEPGGLVLFGKAAVADADGLFTGILANTELRTLRILDSAGQVLAQVEYGSGSSAGKVVAGQSLALCRDWTEGGCPGDTASWGPGLETYDQHGNKGTPGSMNAGCGE